MTKKAGELHKFYYISGSGLKILWSIISMANTIDSNSKRRFLKQIAYAAPVIATFKVSPALATIGSEPTSYTQKGNNGVGNRCDPQPPGNPPINDACGKTGPGSPGNRGKFFSQDSGFFKKRYSRK